jgi:hypothetical protein
MTAAQAVTLRSATATPWFDQPMSVDEGVDRDQDKLNNADAARDANGPDNDSPSVL